MSEETLGVTPSKLIPTMEQAERDCKLGAAVRELVDMTQGPLALRRWLYGRCPYSGSMEAVPAYSDCDTLDEAVARLLDAVRR